MEDENKAEIEAFIKGPGEPMDFGCHPDKFTDYVKVARDVANKKTCVVKDWIWVDLDVSEKHMKMIADHGTQPSLVYAHHCIEDSAGRFKAGEWVRTTPLVEFHEPCIFETLNTLYLLCGPGQRKCATPMLMSKIEKGHIKHFIDSLATGLSGLDLGKH